MSLDIRPSVSLIFHNMKSIYYVYLIVFILLLFSPLFLTSRLCSLLALANIMAMLAMSWDVLGGYTGLISFGHAFFFGLSGYVTAILNLKLNMSIYLSIPIGVLIALIIAVILLVPSLKLKGPYFSLITLLLPIIAFRLICAGTSSNTGGLLGFAGVQPLAFDDRWSYIITLLFMISTLIALKMLLNSRIGMILVAIREDEAGVEAVGINVRKYKIVSLTISAFIACISGSLLVHYLTVIAPSTFFGFDLCIQPIIMTIIGGMGTIIGPVIGAVFFTIIQEYLRPLGDLRLFIFSLATLVCLYFMPKGIVPTIFQFNKRQ